MRISDWSSDVCSSDLIRGCVPKKLLSYAAHFHEDFEDAAGFGWTVEGARFDWATLIANKDKEIDRLEGIYEKLLANAGVQAYHGHARLLDPHKVEVGVQRFTGKTVLIPRSEARRGGKESVRTCRSRWCPIK